MEKKTVNLRLPVDMVEALTREAGAINQGVVDAITRLRVHERCADQEIRNTLTPAEWSFLADSLNGLNPEGFRFDKHALILHCQDSETYDGTATRWGVDIRTLCEKLDEFTAAHVDAVYRRVQRFWDEQPDINQWSQY